MAALPGMNKERAIALYLYTVESPLYHKLNDALQAEDRTVLRENYFPFLRIFFEALGCFPPVVEAQTLTRGVKLDLVTMHPDEFAEGEELVWFRMSSCTRSIEVLKSDSFLGITGPRTILSITTTRGIDISAFSAIVSNGLSYCLSDSLPACQQPETSSPAHKILANGERGTAAVWHGAND